MNDKDVTELLDLTESMTKASSNNFNKITSFVELYQPHKRNFDYLKLEEDFYNEFIVKKEEIKKTYDVVTVRRSKPNKYLPAIVPAAGIGCLIGAYISTLNFDTIWTLILAMIFLLIVSAIVGRLNKKEKVENITIKLMSKITTDNFAPTTKKLRELGIHTDNL
jgi:hypothetical protein